MVIFSFTFVKENSYTHQGQTHQCAHNENYPGNAVVVGRGAEDVCGSVGRSGVGSRGGGSGGGAGIHLLLLFKYDMDLSEILQKKTNKNCYVLHIFT